MGARVPAATTATASPPSDEALKRFLATAERYGCWNATEQENAKVGLRLE